MGPLCGPLASLKGFELWAPILKVACNGVTMAYEDSKLEAHTGGP